MLSGGRRRRNGDSRGTLKLMTGEDKKISPHQEELESVDLGTERGKKKINQGALEPREKEELDGVDRLSP